VPEKLINPNALVDLDRLAADYESAEPFPHLVIDDFLLPEAAEAIHAEVRGTATNINVSNEITQHLKTATNDWNAFGPRTLALINYFNSAGFIAPLETIAGIDGLFGDPWLEGGGIHQTVRGGFLKMHTDFNWNPKLRADRRINILYYLNKDWQPDHKGELIISRLGEKNQRVIAPIFNRLVIFNTNDTTLHGHPFPLKFPENYSRASVAMYYYSNGLDVKERLRRRATTTRFLPMHAGDIDLRSGTLRARVGYLLRRFTRA
jgi:Rps23 Pro-64 3,4-dihydroxylase Tpa1-like proline 4-hydroxylase